MDTSVTTPPPSRFVDPKAVTSHCHIKPGDTVADIGAGTGFFMSALVQAVGPEGIVYASEIQRPLLENLGDTARRQGYSAVQAVWGDVETIGGTKIQTDSCDVVLMVNTLFQLEDVPTALAEINRILRDGGKCIIVDWSESFAGLGPQPEQVVSAQNAINMLETAEFVFEREFDTGDHHYGLAARAVKKA